jgi:hypothetical protein
MSLDKAMLLFNPEDKFGGRSRNEPAAKGWVGGGQDEGRQISKVQ